MVISSIVYYDMYDYVIVSITLNFRMSKQESSPTYDVALMALMH